MENGPLFFGIQQRKRLFVRFAEKIGKDDQPNSRKAHGQPGGGIALAVQQAAQEQIANAGKGTADDGDEGIHRCLFIYFLRISLFGNVDLLIFFAEFKVLYRNLTKLGYTSFTRTTIFKFTL